jgi:hypothetical protein
MTGYSLESFFKKLNGGVNMNEYLKENKATKSEQ